MRNKELFAALKSLDRAVDASFDSQQDCIGWSNRVAPLLSFNRRYQKAFLEYAHIINVPTLSAMTYGNAVSHMVSILKQAIVELENGLSPRQAAESVASWYSRPVGILFLGVLASLIATAIWWWLSR